VDTTKKVLVPATKGRKRGAAAQRINFTERWIRAIKPPAEKRVAYRDRQVKELGLLVQPSGHRAFFWFRKVRNRPTWKTIGAFEDVPLDAARDQARAWSVATAAWKRNKYEGDNPLDPPRKELTFAAVVDAYIERHLKGHAHHPDRAVKNVRWAVDLYLAAFKNRTLSEIRRDHMRRLHEELGEKNGRPTANRILQLVRTVINFARNQELWRGENPVVGIKMFHEEKRARFVLPDEMPRLFKALKTEENPDVVDFIKLALWTGARKSDVLSMRWSDVQLDDNKWTIPHPKNRTPYTVALTPQAVSILKNRQRNRVNDSIWIFPGCGKTGHVTDFKKRWKELLKRAGIQNLRQHDLRRTLGSWQAAGGASLTIIGKSLGHSSLAATQIYSQVNLDPVRESVVAATQAMILASKKKPKLPKLLVAVNGD
jgi:integrase